MTQPLEIEDHPVTKAEHEFYRAFVTILTHLQRRALNAELQVVQQRDELAVRREQVEYLSSELADARAALATLNAAK